MDFLLSFFQKYLLKQIQRSAYSSLFVLGFLVLYVFSYYLSTQQKHASKAFERAYQSFEQNAKAVSRAAQTETAESVLQAKAELKARKRYFQQANKQCLAMQTEIYNQLASAKAEMEAQVKLIERTFSDQQQIS